MADLVFTTDLVWQGTGRDGEGDVKLGNQQVTYSAPDTMGGKGTGTSPEELLMSAVASCYSATLFGILKRAELAVNRVEIRVEGIVTGYPAQAKFATLRVHPTIQGGNTHRQTEYVEMAKKAHDKCFIGKTIAGNVAYEVGEVHIVGA